MRQAARDHGRCSRYPQNAQAFFGRQGVITGVEGIAHYMKVLILAVHPSEGIVGLLPGAGVQASFVERILLRLKVRLVFDQQIGQGT
jgi:hypothetical protein